MDITGFNLLDEEVSESINIFKTALLTSRYVFLFTFERADGRALV